MPAGWAINPGATFGTISARWPRKSRAQIWIDTPRSVVSNSPAPTGKAVVVDGGYRVRRHGRQGFSTGCRHASWIAVHAQVIENGGVRQLNDGTAGSALSFVPVAQAELLDTWRYARHARHGHASLRSERRVRTRGAQRARGRRAAHRAGAALQNPVRASRSLPATRGGARQWRAVASTYSASMAGSKTPRFMAGPAARAGRRPSSP